MTLWPALFAAAGGLRLDQPAYERDFGEQLWAAGGAVRYADPNLVAGYEEFARGLYEAGEDVESYFKREIAQLPPPRPAAGPGR